jgi:perosamine synthetase
MKSMIKLASPDIQTSDIQHAVKVINSGNLVQGKVVAEFEAAISAFTQIPNCAVVSSGTAALHLGLLSLGIGPGDTVIVPAFTFPATANAVENTGANVLLCDVDTSSYVITPELLQATISENSELKIKAVMVVHEFGYPAHIREIVNIAQKNDLKVIEDAACALGTYANGHHVGHFGDVACFSFHPRKAITTGEGGALVSSDLDLIDRVKSLRNHGMKQLASEIDFILPGLNYRMTDFQAALALGQLKRFPQEIVKRRYLAGQYLSLLGKLDRILLPETNEDHSWQSFMIVLDEQFERSKIIESLLVEGIQTNLGAQALNCLSYFKDKYGLADNNMPNAAILYRNGLVLPIYGKLESTHVKFISQALKKLLTN